MIKSDYGAGPDLSSGQWWWLWTAGKSGEGPEDWRGSVALVVAVIA